VKGGMRVFLYGYYPLHTVYQMESFIDKWFAKGLCMAMAI